MTLPLVSTSKHITRTHNSSIDGEQTLRIYDNNNDNGSSIMMMLMRIMRIMMMIMIMIIIETIK